MRRVVPTRSRSRFPGADASGFTFDLGRTARLSLPYDQHITAVRLGCPRRGQWIDCSLEKCKPICKRTAGNGRTQKDTCRITDRPISLVSPHGRKREDTNRNDHRQSFDPKVVGSIPTGPTGSSRGSSAPMQDSIPRTTSATETMERLEITLTTGSEPTVVDLTSHTERFCSGKGDGLLSIFVPHATAGLAIVETGAGSDHDMMTVIDELLPPTPSRWNHDHGSPGHGRDHVLPAFLSPSITVPVADGALLLGTWQSIVLIDTNRDNPKRRILLSFLPG